MNGAECVVCPTCQGGGEMIAPQDQCPNCKGEKTVQVQKILEVEVEKGMQQGQKIVFYGESDEAPGTIPGDLIFVIKEKEHELFKYLSIYSHSFIFVSLTSLSFSRSFRNHTLSKN
jgi:DnaJ-class molecular chaperone